MNGRPAHYARWYRLHLSDYQHVRLLAKTGRVLTLEVTETHPDMDALSAVIEVASDVASLRAGSESVATKLAAMLLLDEKGRLCEITPPNDDPQPEDFVAAAQLVECQQIATSTSDRPMYRAVLRVTVTDNRYADPFEVDQSWGAVAYSEGDFKDCFG
jgi:hypothetical protein